MFAMCYLHGPLVFTTRTDVGFLCPKQLRPSPPVGSCCWAPGHRHCGGFSTGTQWIDLDLDMARKEFSWMKSADEEGSNITYNYDLWIFMLIYQDSAKTRIHVPRRQQERSVAIRLNRSRLQILLYLPQDPSIVEDR